MRFVKFLAGVIMAIGSFFMMVFAILGFFVEQLTLLAQGIPITFWPLIVIGISGFLMFLGGTYILRFAF
jgi:hypothetical protein